MAGLEPARASHGAYETSPDRPTFHVLADEHDVSRSTIFKRAARERREQNAAPVDAARQQIVQKMEASLEAKAAEAAELAAIRVMAELQLRNEREKVKHIKRAVRIAKRGFGRTEKPYDENAEVRS